MANYLFVTYIFLLCALLIFVFVKGTKSKLEKKVEELEEKQKELIALQNDTKDAIMVFESYMYEANQKIEDKLKSAGSYIEKINEVRDQVELSKNYKPQKPKEVPSKKNDFSEHLDNVSIEYDEFVKMGTKKPSGKDKTKVIRELYAKGKTKEQIAQDLGISKGEVNLILGIGK